jgi:hypothetical protein
LLLERRSFVGIGRFSLSPGFEFAIETVFGWDLHGGFGSFSVKL